MGDGTIDNQRQRSRRWVRRGRANGRAPLPERRPRLAFLFAAVPILAIGAMLLSAPLFYTVDTTLNKVIVTPVPNVVTDPKTGQPTVLPLPDWDKKERINILLIGVDKRPEDEYGRTDTMIVASIDPATKTVGIMSLPRDLKVKIPGYNDDKLNAAFVYGDMDHYPGGGAGLLKRTIYVNFGINIHYFAEVDFNGFEKIVDTFGGVTVDAPYPIKDDEYPTVNNGYQAIYFSAGLHHLNGQQALWFARTRHADNDLGREARQQQVILGLRQQALSRDLVGKFWQLADVLGNSIKTDLTVQQAAALAKLGQGIPRENIKTYSLQDLVSDYTDPDTGIDYLTVDWSKARARVREMIPDAEPPATPTPDAGLHIAVRNGAQIPGLAGRTVDKLHAAGFNGATVDETVVSETMPTTVIYDYTGQGDEAFLLAQKLGLPQTAVRAGQGQRPAGVDILVILGQDAAYGP